MTTEERKRETPGACGQLLVLHQIMDRWSGMIIGALKEEPLRFNQMKRRLEGITQKPLTQTLRRLERNGMISRQVIPTSQVAVRYSLTPLGRTLEVPFRALSAWTHAYLEEVNDARKQFDEARPGPIIGDRPSPRSRRIPAPSA